MIEIATENAGPELRELLEHVERGEPVNFTRGGRPIARMTLEPDESIDASDTLRQDAVRTVLEKSARLRPTQVTHERIKDWIEEGRT
jgi:antitoxin (DNA-binding transcriptional repressor) of toxin-antitoxin stability system